MNDTKAGACIVCLKNSMNRGRVTWGRQIVGDESEIMMGGWARSSRPGGPSKNQGFDCEWNTKTSQSFSHQGITSVFKVIKKVGYWVEK